MRRLWVSCLLLALTVSAPAFGAGPFDKAEYAARRGRLMEKIPDGAAVFLGATTPADDYEFRQGHDFLYFTGRRDSRRLPDRRRDAEGERPVLHDGREDGRRRGHPPRADPVGGGVHRDREGAPGGAVRRLPGDAEPTDPGALHDVQARGTRPRELQREVQRPAEVDDAEPLGRASHAGTPVRPAAAGQVPAGRRPRLLDARSGTSGRSSRRRSWRSCARPGGSASRPTTRSSSRPGPACRRRRWRRCSSSCRGRRAPRTSPIPRSSCRARTTRTATTTSTTAC